MTAKTLVSYLHQCLSTRRLPASPLRWDKAPYQLTTSSLCSTLAYPNTSPISLTTRHTFQNTRPIYPNTRVICLNTRVTSRNTRATSLNTRVTYPNTRVTYRNIKVISPTGTLPRQQCVLPYPLHPPAVFPPDSVQPDSLS